MGERSKGAGGESSDERFRALANATREAIVIHEGGVVREVNRAFTELLGYTREEMIGVNGLATFIARESHEVVTRSMHSEGSGTALQVTVISKAGERRIVDSYSEPLEYLGRPMRMVAMQDITARLQAETERRELERQLAHSQRMEAVGRLAGGIAHDFNNLLTVILAHADVAASDLPAGHPAAESLSQIVEASQRAAALTRQLLIFARKDIVEPKRVNLNRTVEELAQLLRRVLGEHIELSLELYLGVWPVLIDPVQLEQLVMNLALNARDAMRRGGTLHIATRNVEGAAKGDEVELRVTDSGVGMSPETLSRAFEPFFTTKSAGRGTGLGLWTCAAVVQRASGSIRAESSIGHGTTFFVRFPRAIGRSDPPRPEEPATRPKGRETILLVEDDEHVRTLTARLLRGWGYRVFDAAEPNEALRLAAENVAAIDLVLSDVVMPGRSGPELVRALCDTQPQARVLYVSGYPGDEIEDLMSDPSTPILSKPYAPDDLALRIRQVLDQKRS